MNHVVTRRQFALASSTAVVGGIALPRLAMAQSPTTTTKPAAGFDKGPPLEADLNRQVVGESHRNLERVIELVTADQELVNAVWDWGGGDFETPLGAAAHTGQREIALYLLKHGARMDVFAAAMLGHLDVVKAAIAADPMTRFTLGPHGITLIRHAEAGGDEAAAVLAHLQTLDTDDAEVRDLPLSARAIRRYVGVFKQDSDASQEHEFTATDGRLWWSAAGTPTMLAHRGNHEFAPQGAAVSKRLRFGIRNGQGVVLEINDGGSTVKASRIS